jgi:ABC-type bacteriocin/lantibiotic exporter with double-glycine peptidase domain
MAGGLLAIVLAAAIPLSNAEDSAVLLDDYGNCGQVCLYAIARLKGKDVTFDRVKQLVEPTPPEGSSLGELNVAARALGLFPVAVAVDRSRLEYLPVPAIAHLKHSFLDSSRQQSHFVVLLHVSESDTILLDPPLPVGSVSRERFHEA